MSKIIALLVALIAPLLQPGTSPPDDVFYLALGDSTAAGIGSSLPRTRSYPSILNDNLAKFFDATPHYRNLAEPGESASGFLGSEQFRRFQAEIEALGSTNSRRIIVTLSLGGNDVLDLENEPVETRQNALDEFREDYPEVLQSVLSEVASDALVAVSTVYDPSGENPAEQFSDAWWISQFNEVIRSAATEAGIVLVDLADQFGSETGLTRYPADVHPTNDGHKHISRMFWQALELDQQAPEIDIAADILANRRTPTLDFELSPDVDINSIEIVATEPDVIVHSPIRAGERAYRVLVDASDSTAGSVSIEIRVRDNAGNGTTSRTNVRLP